MLPLNFIEVNNYKELSGLIFFTVLFFIPQLKGLRFF